MANQYQLAQLEFAQKGWKILALTKNPLAMKLTSAKKKQRILCEFVDSLTQDTLILYINEIINMINMKENICKQFDDSEEQYNSIIEWLPRMKDFKPQVMERIQERRNEYGLKM